MRLLAVGCNHKTAPVEVRERLSFDRRQVTEALGRLRQEHPDCEAALLSTCNRVELYLAGPEENSVASFDPTEWLCQWRGLDTAATARHFYRYEAREAVRHLFAVAASLDSMVLGETQILSQVKEAYELARGSGTVGTTLNMLFQAAVAAAKQVHRDTAITRGKVSVSSVAVEFACEVFDASQFSSKTILVIGAGKMAELTLQHLLELKPGCLLVTNRSPEKAVQLAERFRGEAVPFERLDQWLARADLVLSTTASSEPIVDRHRFARVMEARQWRPVVIIDIAVPRDFASDVAELENVYLYNIDDLEQQRDKNLAARERELEAAWLIVDRAAEECWTRLQYHHRMGPVVTRLRAQFDAIREEELRRLFRTMPGLSEEQREKIAHAFRRYENRLLHLPSSALRDEGRNGAAHGLLEALEKLFRLR